MILDWMDPFVTKPITGTLSEIRIKFVDQMMLSNNANFLTAMATIIVMKMSLQEVHTKVFWGDGISCQESII